MPCYFIAENYDPEQTLGLLTFFAWWGRSLSVQNRDDNLIALLKPRYNLRSANEIFFIGEVLYPNNSCRIAALVGFVWYDWASGYLGLDMEVDGWVSLGTLESPLILPVRLDGLDYCIYLNPKMFESMFIDYPEMRFVAANEWIGYLHVQNSGYVVKNGNK